MNTFSTFKLDVPNINELIIKLTHMYPLYFQEPERIKEILCLFKLKKSDSVTLIIETDHTDRQYRDSYYSYFSQKYSNFERNCLRLVFFEGHIKHDDFMSDISKLNDDFLIGTIVLRPLNVGNIGLTLLNPHKLKLAGYVQTCKFKIMICGRKFTIKAFPYLSQDNETITCAETALFNLIQYYSEKYCEYRILMPSEILQTLEASSYERVLPSNGVSDVNISKVLQEGHFHPRLYFYAKEGQQDFEELFYAYIESGLPFILGLPSHVVICIGHGAVDFKIDHHKAEDITTCCTFESQKFYYINTAKLVDEYIFMDDNQTPYVISTLDKLTAKYGEDFVSTNEESDEYYNEESEITIDENISKPCVEYDEETLYTVKKDHVSLLVPLYKRIFLDASRAKSIFDEHFIKNPDFIKKIQEAYCDDTWGRAMENPLVWRMYLAPSNSYKNFKCKTALNIDIYNYYSTQSYPRFIWVLEIGNISTFSDGESRVEVLLDATSSINSDTWAILSIGYKEHLVFVPYVVQCLRKEQNIEALSHKQNSPDNSDYSSVDWNKTNEDVKQKVLTKIFESLYYKPNKFMNGTYKTFANCNLKEI